MKSGVRALGIAESYREDASHSTLAGAVVRADGVLEDLGYAACTVGGTDATDAVVDILEELLRPDVRAVLLGAVAPAWYNLFDLSRIAAVADRPVLAVTFEASSGLEPALREAFSGRELESRLDVYRSLPERHAVEIGEDGDGGGETVYLRHRGCDRAEAAELVRGFTLAGGRPEPIRVASVAARAGETYRTRFEMD